MSFDPTPIEADLHKVRPAALNVDLLDRLDACADASWAELSPAEVRQEQQLRAITPAQLSPALMASLEAALREVPFSQAETIIGFPVKKSTTQPSRRSWWGAAAAVALTGAITALLIPANSSPRQVAGNSPEPPNISVSPSPSELIPAGFNRGLSEASDEGVIWQSNQPPHRVLKMIYKEQVTLKDANGRVYQIEQPRVEYILVPTKND